MRFAEIRIHVLDANSKPADLTTLKGEIVTRPARGPAFAQALQLMLPHDPGQSASEGERVPLKDGRALVVQVLRPSAPFELPPGTSAYFKADREWPAGEAELAAVVKISSPEGESQAEFRLKA